MKAFFDDLPFTSSLFTTPKGDAVVHLAVLHNGDVAVRWLASLQRGAGREALRMIVEAADRHRVTLELFARPQPPAGDGKKMTPQKLEAFYASFGFVTTGRGGDGFAHMVRKPT